MRLLFISLLLIGCGSVENPFEKQPEEELERVEFDSAYARLVHDFTVDGYIVSREDGEPEHTGEAILWAGIAAGALPCDKANRFIHFLAKMSTDNGGYFERWSPLGEKYEDRPINFDGMSGVYFGFAGYLSRCGSNPAIVDAWGMHRAYLEENEGRLHPNIEETYPKAFDSVLQSIDYKLGLRGSEPSKDALTLVSATASGWAAATVASKEACYRIHLGYLQLKALDMLGTPTGRTSFCKATGKLGNPRETAIDIPLIDHYCGRQGLEQYLDDFEFDRWEMRHQRCGLWETPDGNGDETPGLDYLIGYSEFYQARLK